MQIHCTVNIRSIANMILKGISNNYFVGSDKHRASERESVPKHKMNDKLTALNRNDGIFDSKFEQQGFQNKTSVCTNFSYFLSFFYCSTTPQPNLARDGVRH